MYFEGHAKLHSYLNLLSFLERYDGLALDIWSTWRVVRPIFNLEWHHNISVPKTELLCLQLPYMHDMQPISILKCQLEPKPIYMIYLQALWELV